MCKIGKNQSPVDINPEGLLKGCLKPIEFHYVADAKYVVNNGHTIKVVTKGESYIVVDGRKFYLRQFHFHSPSEHTINGKHYPFEAHFVHTDDKGNIAVIGVLFKVGKENSTLQRIWENIPLKVGERKVLTFKVNPYYLIPGNKDYYRYSGSLTTPPCNEGVRWFVMKQAVELSPEQLGRFYEAMRDIDNNRPVQPLNARKVIY
jgi:carbonic anhydrase